VSLFFKQILKQISRVNITEKSGCLECLDVIESGSTSWTNSLILLKTFIE
jgi:hypothetical protein